MKEIRCPKCGNVITVDEADYAAIVNQVKNAEFDAEVNRRIGELNKQHEAEQQARDARAGQAHQLELSEKDREIAELKATIDQNEQTLEVAILKERQQAEEASRAKDQEIIELKSKALLAAKEAELREKNIKAELEGELKLAKSEAQLQANNIRGEYEAKLKVAQEQVDYYKDLKAKLSTKMVGETLEAHCSTIFNGEMRPMFPSAYFEKDNDASGGSKGDFIFRDYDGKTEYISIMFEMKNEQDETATKHKNEDFFKKLDADRTAKGCEYAVLVSLLEPDSELYNTGIVDVSHRYPKMYVIRPQFFRAIIMLLVNAAKNTVGYKKEIALIRQENYDVTNFEDKLIEFRETVQGHYNRAKGKFEDAIKQIDETIKKLEAIKKSFQQSDNYLRLASQDTEELTIRKLTYKNPTMKAKFDAARKARQAQDGTEPEE